MPERRRSSMHGAGPCGESRARLERAGVAHRWLAAIVIAGVVLPIPGLPAEASDPDIAIRATRSHVGAAVQAGKFSAAPPPIARRDAPNLIANGGFDAQPNPLAFWSNAPGAFATWVAEGANGSIGAVHLRFLPPVSRGVAARGAIYYTGLTQCVAVEAPGRYIVQGYARVPSGASAASVPGLTWRLRGASPACSGPAEGSGSLDFVRSTTWVASPPATIEIDELFWTPGTTLEFEVGVGDSSTGSIEAVEALVDGVSLVAGPLFADGFEAQ